MKEIVTKYLESNYRISVASLKNYKLYDIKNDRLESLHSIFISLRTIFGVKDEELELIVNPWMEMQATILHNRITDIQYKIYKATGVEIRLTQDQLAALIETEEGLDNYEIGNHTIYQEPMG